MYIIPISYLSKFRSVTHLIAVGIVGVSAYVAHWAASDQGELILSAILKAYPHLSVYSTALVTLLALYHASKG